MSIVEFNLAFKDLKTKISKKETFDEGINLLLNVHALVFPKELSTLTTTYESMILDNVNNDDYSLMPLNDEKTIAYYLYHLTRIEDITSNLLIAKQEQVFYKENYQERLNSTITTTGNELTKDEIVTFSKNLNIDELKKYRLDVGRNTEEIIKKLKFSDLKRKVAKEDIDRILQERSISRADSAIWLLDYWGNKNVLGLLLMPISRHHMVHLNSCERIVKGIRKKGIQNEKSI